MPVDQPDRVGQAYLWGIFFRGSLGLRCEKGGHRVMKRARDEIRKKSPGSSFVQAWPPIRIASSASVGSAETS